MTRAFAVAAFLLFASAAHGAEPAGQTFHAEPAADDNLRLYAVVEAPSVTFVLDGGAPLEFGGMSVGFTRMEPGPHEVTATLPGGERAFLSYTLNTADLIESRGHRWWCLLAVRHEGRLTLIQAAPEQCKGVTDAGPN